LLKLNRFFIPYVIVLILIGFKGKLAVAFSIAIFHEFAHYITAVFFGFSGFDVEILPIGAVLKLKDLDDATPKQDLIISLSGPLINIILAVVFYFLSKNYSSDFYTLMYEGNLSLGVFNLIPAFPLDGGRALRDILANKTIYKVANNLTVKYSIIIGSLMMFLYFILFLKGISNFNIGLIALFIIISSLKEKERIVYLIMGDIIKKRCKFIGKKYIENKSMSIYYKAELINALSIVDKNKYNIFTILDENMRVMDIIYEDELVEALKEHGNITVEEFIAIRENNM